MDVESSKFTRFVIKLDSVSNRNDVLVKKHLLSINLSPIQSIIGKKINIFIFHADYTYSNCFRYRE